MANGNSYLGLTSRAEELNVGENSQAELDVSARAGFATSEQEEIILTITLVKRKKEKKKEKHTTPKLILACIVGYLFFYVNPLEGYLIPKSAFTSKLVVSIK